MVRLSDGGDGGGADGGSIFNARLASTGRDFGSGTAASTDGAGWSVCPSGDCMTSWLSMCPNSASKSERAERMTGREGYLIEEELRAEPDPNRSSNEDTLTLLGVCGFRTQAMRSKSTIQAASPDVTTSAATAKTALPNKEVPRLEESP